MGSSCETAVRTDCGPTRLPTCVVACPATPVMRERTRVKPRLILAVSTAACAVGDRGVCSGDVGFGLCGLLCLGVELALRDGVLRGEGCVAVYVNLRELQLRLSLTDGSLGLTELAFGLFQRGLEGTRVDLEEDLALLNDGALAVVLLEEVAGDLRLDVRVDVAVQSADPFVGDGDIGLLDGDDVDGQGAHGSDRLRVVTAGEKHGRESSGCCEHDAGSTGGLQPIRFRTAHPNLSEHAARVEFRSYRFPIATCDAKFCLYKRRMAEELLGGQRPFQAISCAIADRV